MSQIETPNSFSKLTTFVNSLLNLSPKEIIVLSSEMKVNYLENYSMLEVELEEVTITCLFDNERCKSSLLFGEESFFYDYIKFCNNFLSQSQVGKNTWFHNGSLITAHEAKEIPVVIFTLNPYMYVKS